MVSREQRHGVSRSVERALAAAAATMTFRRASGAVASNDQPRSAESALDPSMSNLAMNMAERRA
jgi:hypothetical protein